jgi:hypothetical protein
MQRVAVAARAVLGTVGDIAHEVLLLSAEFVDLAPLPGLAPAAKTLLNIWDAMQDVDVRRCKGSVERRTGSVVTDVPITRAVDTDCVHASCRTRCPWHRPCELIGIRGGSAYIAHGGMIIRACSI